MSAPASSDLRHRTAFPDGVSQLAGRYDGFLLDQWGVLHDGAAAHEGAIACLEAMRAAGKRVVILSNSGRDGSENEAILARMGFSRDLYDSVVSAGDDARDALLRRDEPAYRDLGTRCLPLTRPGEQHLADGLGLTLVDAPEQADFLFVLSIDAEKQSVAGWRPVLERALSQGLPMICGNPDRHRVHPGGRLLEAPGAIALAYERMGGVVHYHGKPEPRIYRTCLQRLGLPPSRLLAIGDSLEHDVAGAARAGVDCLFIAGGIHRDELSWSEGDQAFQRSCEALFARNAASPTYCLPTFAWGTGSHTASSAAGR
ncbi:TIGR01459 family HAD-type hydrolase [Bosea sp. BH3]|uniref:TIGR01459 family HAD-type hydrolase n=1 Tax=Bosea sp. BH3 TaxID=2871701 RepID=UPI0021CB1F95|nr:TIGR01459 family HAD-type hydrolase [Bosea sp. BH3]MCU4179253.1 TIGR01459 family HAD-type hydrolase [Bosea sp. BH3]